MKKLVYLFISLFMCFSFASCLDIPDGKIDKIEKPTVKPEQPVEPGQPGEEEKPNIKEQFDCITIAEALELAAEAGTEGTAERYYVYGVIEEVENSTYGSMTIKDETGSIYVYGVYGKDETTRYDALDEKPVAGDEVVLYGKLKTYGETQEMDRGYLQAYTHVEVEIDDSDYAPKTVLEARKAEVGEKVKLTGVVARITYAYGMVPNGFYIVDNTNSIYVYGKDAAASVKIGNTVTVIGEKTYYILENEISAAEKHGYQGCCQIQNAIVLENDKKVSDFDKSWVQETTIKDIMETGLENNITTTIYKVNSLVKKVPGSGFVNYYFDDLDGVTGSYTYTSCSGSDFAWLDEFDGKVCTVYLSVINAKATAGGCVYRFVPILVTDENYKFDLKDAADFAIKYYVADQFLSTYEADPELEVLTTVENDLIGLTGVKVEYSSSNEKVAYFEEVEGKLYFHAGEAGKAVITVTATYEEYKSSKEIEITVDAPVEYETITVKEAINTPDDTEVIVRGVVLSSLVNQNGFYLIDETGVIAVTGLKEDIALLSVGDEVIVKGTKDHKVKEGYTGAGQINIYNSTILVNYYGNHDYSNSTFITGKTVEEFHELDCNEDHSTEIYVLKAIVIFEDKGYYTNCKLTSLDGSVSITLYSSSAKQYSFLEPFSGKEVEVELAACNWNSKTYYAGCVVSVTYDGQKVMNTLNFNE